MSESSQHSDKLLKVFRRVEKGNKKAQVELFKAYFSYAMSVSLRYCYSSEEAKEVVHDSFIKAYANFPKFEELDSFKRWFRRIIINTSIDYYRKYSRYYQQYSIDEITEPAAESGIISDISAKEILEMANGLSPAYRMVFMLYIVEGYKHHEIANMLSISVGASKSNLSKAKAKMQEMINALRREKIYG